VRALDGVDLDVARGEIVAVLGVSGSGKSTLLHLLAGLDTPTDGSLEVDGRDLGRMSASERTDHRRRTVGIVFQSCHLLASRTALGNLEVASTLQGVFGPEARRRAEAALEAAGIGHRAAHRPSEMSGGEQQRVAIARAIVHEPPLLLLDEPTGNLDRATAVAIRDLLASIRERRGTTEVLVTHDEELARDLADRVIRLRDGRVVDDAAPTEASP